MKSLSLFSAGFILLLSGCSIMTTEEERLKNCEAKGISKDTCYLVEKADRRQEKDQSDTRLHEQNLRVIKQMGIKGLGLPE
ncbi:hypothetical protein [Enterobacter sp.]|uniref:hypothetical protein n=1 Tax=Enterobacter sp. TaxID=42895 RepID=UPI0031DD387B